MDLGFMQKWRSDAATTFRATREVEAAALLLDCLRAGEPVVVMTGASGLGKTVVLDATLSRLGPAEPRVLRLEAPFPTPLGLQECLANALAVPDPKAASPADLAGALLALPEPAPGVASLAVVVDDAEAIPLPLLQYLWLMHSLACHGRPALQLVLVGRDALWRRLGDERLSGLRRGVSARLAMQPFSATEAAEFLRHLLKARGRRAEPDAVAEMLLVGAGVPGRLVTLLDAACAGLSRRRTLTLRRVRTALGTPTLVAEPAGSRLSGGFGDLAQAWLARWPSPRLPYLGAGAASLLLLVTAWQLLGGGNSSRPAAGIAPGRARAAAAAAPDLAASRPSLRTTARGSVVVPAGIATAAPPPLPAPVPVPQPGSAGEAAAAGR